MLESYFHSKGNGAFLSSEKVLTPNQRKSIVNCIVDFIFESFGNDPTRMQKANTAQAAIILFPGLEYVGGDGEGTVSEMTFSSKVMSTIIFLSNI